jgi:cell pole-organizing protein PopZ
MTQPAKSQEPSMEEILASIRRIIADDDATKSAPPAPEPPKPVAAAPARPAAPPPAAPSRAAFPEPGEAETAPQVLPLNGAGIDDQSADILDLTESMAAPAPVPPMPLGRPHVPPGGAPSFQTINGESDVDFDDGSGKAPRSLEESQLVSRATSAAVDSAFNTLAQTVLVQNARTLEDLVREMLRPMLKSWLDENLPGMVDRLVRSEIERVSRGR